MDINNPDGNSGKKTFGRRASVSSETDSKRLKGNKTTEGHQAVAEKHNALPPAGISMLFWLIAALTNAFILLGFDAYAAHKWSAVQLRFELSSRAAFGMVFFVAATWFLRGWFIEVLSIRRSDMIPYRIKFCPEEYEGDCHAQKMWSLPFFAVLLLLFCMPLGVEYASQSTR